MHKRAAFLYLVVCVLPMFGQHLVTPGPFGRPIEIEDEAGRWVIPITVYEDADVAVFVPDITTEGWKSWHGPRYWKEGKYVVDVYTFFKNDRVCMSEMVATAKQNNIEIQKACADYTYKIETLIVDTRATSVTSVMIVRLGKGARMYGDSVDKKTATYPFVKLDKMTEKAVRRTNEIVAKELTSQYK